MRMESAAVEIDGSVMEGVSTLNFIQRRNNISAAAVSRLLAARRRGSAPDSCPQPLGLVSPQGGQILRLSAALSCITGSAIKITKVRAGRSTPGLR